jgi:hypothetical protein
MTADPWAMYGKGFSSWQVFCEKYGVPVELMTDAD